MLEQQMARQTAVLENLDRNVGRLVDIGERQIRIEERQAEQGKAIGRAFDAIDDHASQFDVALGKHDTRIKALEQQAPTNKLASGWVIRGAEWAVALTIGGALVKLLA
jgi:hypothetical protein